MNIPMYNDENFASNEVLFEDQVEFDDEQRKTYPVLLQLTSDSLILRSLESISRTVIIFRDPNTYSFGFSIKGGRETGFPVLISRISKENSHSLNIGDVISAINYEDISSLTHQQVISKIHQIKTNYLYLTVQYINNLAQYLHSNGLIHTNNNPIIERYSLLYARVSQYHDGFRLYAFDHVQTGIFTTKTMIEKNMWMSKINLVIRYLIGKKIKQLNEYLFFNEQILYANWIDERKIYSTRWRAVFLVIKDTNFYIFGEDQTPPLTTSDFLSCQRIYSILEIVLEVLPYNSSLTNRSYSFLFHLPSNRTYYLSFERQSDYEDFISHYQHSLHLAVYSIRTRIFPCIYLGETCRLIINIHQGFLMYSKTNQILWRFHFEQLKSSTDDGRDRIYFRFQSDLSEPSIYFEVYCQYLSVLIHVINAFLTVNKLGKEEEKLFLN